MDAALRILILPGWGNSGPQHWQSRWETLHGYRRVEQSDWEQPLRGDWMARLEEVLRDDPRPALLVAHSLGCHLVAHWAGHSRETARVQGALLVAPPDVARVSFPPSMVSWRTPSLQVLPFPSHVVYSTDDPYGSAEQAQAFARAWGSATTCVGAAGHVNADSGLGDWPQGLGLLQSLVEGRR